MQERGYVKKYCSRVFIAFSIFMCAIVGGRHNQTLSALQWERKRQNKLNIVKWIDLLFFMEENHCQDSWVKWQIINHAISKYENIADQYYDEL